MARGRNGATLASGACMAALVACHSYAAEDEARIRADLGIPAAVRLVRVQGKPSFAGVRGREHLRIVGWFELTPAQAASAATTWATAPQWQPLPLPPSVARFPVPPVEILRDVGPAGLYRCYVADMMYGKLSPPGTCLGTPSGSSYRLAVLEPSRGRLIVVARDD